MVVASTHTSPSTAELEHQQLAGFGIFRSLQNRNVTNSGFRISWETCDWISKTHICQIAGWALLTALSLGKSNGVHIDVWIPWKRSQSIDIFTTWPTNSTSLLVSQHPPTGRRLPNIHQWLDGWRPERDHWWISKNFWYELFPYFAKRCPHKKYINIPSEKYIYVHVSVYVYICVYTYVCKMDEYRSYAGLS